MLKNKHNITRYTRISVISMLIMCKMCNASVYGEKEDGIIYILIWTSAKDEPFNFVKMGQEDFNNCAFKNCFITGDHNYFSNLLQFEVVMFNVVMLKEALSLPMKRSYAQKYIMYGVEPAMFHYIPPAFDGYFNLTFTYKLSSNTTIPYIVVKDENDEIIGPKINMSWLKLSEMNETSEYVKKKLQNKSIAAAWIVSNCWTPWRVLYINDLKKELARYGHRVDVFGHCGTNKCVQQEECDVLIESDYYFYLSFENSFGEDYVTEKLLTALEHYAVPVVYGGANYTRFMPEGIYLDATVLPPYQLADRMNAIINDKNQYYEFFKWHDHYRFHYTGENRYHEELCNLCALLNETRNKTSILNHIVDWWHEDHPMWPTKAPRSLEGPQNVVEKFLTKVLDYLDPDVDTDN